jgi:hypothetical protein
MGWLQELSWGWVFAPITAWLFVAYIRRWLAYEAKYDQTPEHDMLITDAWEYLLLKSKWSIGRDPSLDKIQFFDSAHRQIRDNASLGKLRLWGRVYKPDRDPGALVDIKFKNWDTVVFIASYSARLKNQITDEIFVDVMVNQKQFKTLWPKANILKIWRDKTLVKRSIYLHGEG